MADDAANPQLQEINLMDDVEKVALKGCPVCGAEPISRRLVAVSQVYCLGDSARQHLVVITASTPEEAAHLWNTRISSLTTPTVDVEATARELLAAECCSFYPSDPRPDFADGSFHVVNADIAIRAISKALQPKPEVGPLVEFFRGPGFDRFGKVGDYEMWSAEQTAVHFLTEYLNATTQVEWPVQPKPTLSGGEFERVRRAIAEAQDPEDDIDIYEALVNHFDWITEEQADRMIDAATRAALTSIATNEQRAEEG